MNSDQPSAKPTQIRSRRSRRTLGSIEEDLDSLSVLRQGSAVAILLVAGYLLLEAFGYGFAPHGLFWVAIALAEVTAYHAGLWLKSIRALWRPWSLCFGILLITTFALFAHVSQKSEVVFVSALLCPLGTAAYVAWSPSWQLAMNLASLAIFLGVPTLVKDPTLYRPAHVMGLLAGLAFAQSSSVYLDRYRRRLRQQIFDLEDAAIFREAQIGAMAHDVRSPLAAVTGYAALLQAEDLTSHERADLIARLGVTAWNMDLVVSNLLDMYQVQEQGFVAVPADIDLNSYLKEVIDSCATHARRRGVELTSQLSPMPPCRQDPRHIERIVKNLAGFAVGRMNSGTIMIVCRTRENQIRIEVADEGPAIPQHEFMALTRPIQRNGTSGSPRALNLYIARMLTEASGGIFTAQIGEKPGMRLIVELPLEAQPTRL
jgi:signal transduction histidine kinase